MKLKAIDTFHVSSLGDIIHAGTEFEVHDALGKEIAAKGLATVTVESTDTTAGADQAEPAEKMEPLSANKMEPAPTNKRGPGRPPKAKAEPVDEPAPEEEA